MDQRRGLVAITGANGNVGYHCTLYALHSGYHVRCIVRTSEAVEVIRNGPSVRKLSHLVDYRIVPDNTIFGAYDEALRGVDYVIHVAGAGPKPHLHPDHEVYTPFVESMRNILTAAERSGTVKRVVFTQSAAGFVNREDGDVLGTGMELELNEYTPINHASAALRPPLKSPLHAYCAAKALSMSFLKDLTATGRLPFSIVQVVSGTVMGPSELVSSVEGARVHIDRISKSWLFNGPRAAYGFAFVHVWDCARIHVEALDESKAPVGSIPDWFVAGAPTQPGSTIAHIWNEVGDMVETEFRNEVSLGLFNVGRHNWPINVPFRVESGLTATMLMNGDDFKSLSQCVREVAAWYKGIVLSDPNGQIHWNFQ